MKHPRNQQRLESLAVQEFPSQPVKPFEIVSDGLAKDRLEFRLIGRGRRQVLVSRQVVTRVDGDGDLMAAHVPAERLHLTRIGCAVTVIGHQYGAGGLQQSRGRPGHTAPLRRRQWLCGLVVDAHNLLPLPVREPAQYSRLGGVRCPRTRAT